MKKLIMYLISALTLIFICLKLADKIDWSWWWVFAPVWVPIVLWLILYTWSLFYCVKQYKQNPNFRKIVDRHNEHKQHESMGLEGRLKEMQRQNLKTKGDKS